jgi:phosphatidylinositol alpha-mannosyltransferase
MIVADNVGFRDLIKGGPEAIVIRHDAPAAWAKAIIALIGDPARREAMGRAGRAKAARYAWPQVAARVLGIYERVVRGRAQRR